MNLPPSIKAPSTGEAPSFCREPLVVPTCHTRSCGIWERRNLKAQMKFSPALPLKLWSVQSGLLIQCTVFFSLSLELFYPATKFYNHWTDTPSVNHHPVLGTTLLLSASLNFPSDTSGKWNCAVFVLLWPPYFTLTNILELHSRCCKWQDILHFKMLKHLPVYVYTTFSFWFICPWTLGSFLGFCVQYSNAYVIVDISWTFSFYLLWT